MSELNTPETPESIDEGIPEVQYTLTVSSVQQAPVDDTLTISGMAADSKATGDKIAETKAELQQEIDSAISSVEAIAGTLFPVGAIYVSTSATAPTFGAENWRWQEIALPVTYGDLMDGVRSYETIGSTTPGTVHFWLRISNAEVTV